MMADEKDRLKLQVGSPGKAVDADAFVSIFQHTIAALKAIDRGFSSHGGETIRWEVVEAGSNSPIFATIRGRDESPARRHGHDVALVFVEGIIRLSRENVCPPGFGRDSLKFLQKIVSDAKLYRLKPVYFSAGLETKVTRIVAANASRARRGLEIGKTRLVEHGTIEGRLRDLSESHSRDKLGIVDKLTGEVTQCYLRDESLEPALLQGWKRRVAVTGDITVDRQSGRPVKVIVDAIRILRDRADLPQIQHLHGINITGGVEPSVYVRGLRDAD